MKPAGNPLSETSSPPLRKARLLILGTFVVGLLLAFWNFHDAFSLEFLAQQRTYLRQLHSDRPLLTAALALLIYVVLTSLSLPGAAGLSLVYGWYFGFWEALLIVSFGSTTGATMSFLLSRYLLRDWVQRAMHERFQYVQDAFAEEGSFYLFTMRLIPAIPFFVVNLLMGLTSIRVSTFWWVSQVGMLPGTVAYVYAGSTFPSLLSLVDKGVGHVVSWPLLLAFGALGVLPLALKRVVAKLRDRRESGEY